MADQSELLDQLTIDRSANDAGGYSLSTLLVLAIVAALLGGGISYALFAKAKPVAEQANAERVAEARREVSTQTLPTSDNETAQADDDDQRILNASGYITARRIATVSSEISGLITQVNVEEGMQVERGQILARLDDAVASVNLRLSESQIKALRAQVEGIEVNLAEAKRVLERSENLREESLASEADVTRNRAAVDALSASLRNARANIAVSKLEVQRQRERLDDHIVKAPFAGVVTVKNAQIGEIVSPGSAGGGFTRTGICTIVDMTSLEIEVDVNEAFIGRVFPGQRVLADLDAYPEWQIPASVIAIIPTADRAKATVKVRIGIEKKDARILPDMGVKVAFLKD